MDSSYGDVSSIVNMAEKRWERFKREERIRLRRAAHLKLRMPPSSFVGEVGTAVPTDVDDFVEFEGTCIGVRNGLLKVRDQEDNVYEMSVLQFHPEWEKKNGDPQVGNKPTPSTPPRCETPDLLDFMARICCYAQSHIQDFDYPDGDKELRRAELLQCTSFQIACLLSQNTHNGENGVEADVILAPLVERPDKTEDEWRRLIHGIALELGGWKPLKKRG